MNRRQLLTLSGALAAATLAGCTDESRPPDTDGTTPPNTSDGETPDGETPDPDPEIDEERLAALAADNARFALDLHRNLAAGEVGNAFLSPYSISVALAMTYAGARGETRRQMTETLHYALGEEIHPAFADLQAELEARETAIDPEDDEEVPGFRLDVANALWGREDFPFADEYLSVLETHYGAGLREADFAGDPEAERERINRWVADQTEDRIEDLLPRGAIDAATVLVLTNAIYFLAGWIHQFDPENTAEGTFRALDGTESTAPFMHQDIRTRFASVDGADVVELPYSGEMVSMLLIVPDEGTFAAFERDLDADRLFGIFERLRDARGTLALPKFEFKSKVRLSEVLSELGMPVAFGGDADFGGMVEGDGRGLWIDEVYHDAFVSVDEEGTEAAAATAVVMRESEPLEWGELRVDRPFLFCVRDRPTDAVLFLGRVVDTSEARPQAD
jgi:serpin B